MLKAGTQTGSLVNHLYSRQTKGAPTPEVGMGATILHWTDRKAGTIIEVADNGKRIVVQQDHAKRTDSNGMSEDQDYDYSPNPDGPRYTFRQNKDGSWNEARFNRETKRWNKLDGAGVGIGFRREYHDFSF